MGWGDGPFFGGSIFQTPPAPQPAPNTYGQYTYGPNHSGFLNSGGQTFTGYQSEPYKPIVWADCNQAR